MQKEKFSLILSKEKLKGINVRKGLKGYPIITLPFNHHNGFGLKTTKQKGVMVPNPAKRHAKGKVLSNPLKGEIKRHKCKERIGRQSHNHTSVQPSQWIRNEYNKHVCHRTCDTDFSLANSCQEAIGKSEYACSKVNENAASVGTLRHALHLRFLCPFPKKNSRSIRRCKSDPLSQKTNFDAEGEQRFYLYNNMRVVFPQRHFDADEGKLNVEYHFPADLKYFDISN